MSLAGFGGVLVQARQVIVDQHRWMTADEFNLRYRPSRPGSIRSEFCWPEGFGFRWRCRMKIGRQVRRTGNWGIQEQIWATSPCGGSETDE
ncbi:MAG: hypothetical protein Q8L92_00600 [Rubrivivax sp.]|nr:hypothetical protein [Rubrivivax sp.]